jgi:hypothetical protein
MDAWQARLNTRELRLARLERMVLARYPLIKVDRWPGDIFKDYRGPKGKVYTLVYARATGELDSAYVVLRTGKQVSFTSAFQWAYPLM